MERDLDNEGPYSATPPGFKGNETKRALTHVIHKNKINGILKEKKSKIPKQIMVPNGIL